MPYSPPKDALLNDYLTSYGPELVNRGGIPSEVIPNLFDALLKGQNDWKTTKLSLVMASLEKKPDDGFITFINNFFDASEFNLTQFKELFALEIHPFMRQKLLALLSQHINKAPQTAFLIPGFYTVLSNEELDGLFQNLSTDAVNIAAEQWSEDNILKGIRKSEVFERRLVSQTNYYQDNVKDPITLSDFMLVVRDAQAVEVVLSPYIRELYERERNAWKFLPSNRGTFKAMEMMRLLKNPNLAKDYNALPIPNSIINKQDFKNAFRPYRADTADLVSFKDDLVKTSISPLLALGHAGSSLFLFGASLVVASFAAISWTIALVSAPIHHFKLKNAEERKDSGFFSTLGWHGLIAFMSPLCLGVVLLKMAVQQLSYCFQTMVSGTASMTRVMLRPIATGIHKTGLFAKTETPDDRQEESSRSELAGYGYGVA